MNIDWSTVSNPLLLIAAALVGAVIIVAIAKRLLSLFVVGLVALLLGIGAVSVLHVQNRGGAKKVENTLDSAHKKGKRKASRIKRRAVDEFERKKNAIDEAMHHD